jgi:hypothetical protein
MSAKLRSISGALLMLVIIPIVAGLLACMPVPIGNPERSRIDSDLNGIWIIESEGESGNIYLFQPWDKRTWLVVGAKLEEGPGYDGEDLDLKTAEDTANLLRGTHIGVSGVTSPNAVAYKAWLTKLGGVQFMTWENVGGFNEDGSHKPKYWWVWRVDKADENRFTLRIVVPEHEVFDDIVSPSEYEGDDYVRATRRKWERALAKVAKDVDDDDLYGGPSDFTRLPDDLVDEASELFEEVIRFESEFD